MSMMSPSANTSSITPAVERMREGKAQSTFSRHPIDSEEGDAARWGKQDGGEE